MQPCNQPTSKTPPAKNLCQDWKLTFFFRTCFLNTYDSTLKHTQSIKTSEHVSALHYAPVLVAGSFVLVQYYFFPFLLVLVLLIKIPAQRNTLLCTLHTQRKKLYVSLHIVYISYNHYDYMYYMHGMYMTFILLVMKRTVNVMTLTSIFYI